MLKFPLSLLVVLVVVLPSIGQLAEAENLKLVEASSKHETKRADVYRIKKHSALSELSPEQIAIASRVSLGKMPCELAAHVSVKSDVRGVGRFVLEMAQQRYFMVPVPTLTGAIRLEDSAAGVVWLQLSNKSMLMSQKMGRRLADECASVDQMIIAKELLRNPTPSLLDGPVRVKVIAHAGIDAEPDVFVAAKEVSN